MKAFPAMSTYAESNLINGVLLAVLLPASIAAQTPVLDARYEPVGGGEMVVAQSQWLAQTVRFRTAGNLSAVELDLVRRASLPLKDLLLEVRSLNPDGSPSIATQTSKLIPAAEVSGSGGFLRVDLTGANVTVQPGSQLALTLRTEAATPGPGSAPFVWRGQKAGTYNDGLSFVSNGFGWTEISYDFGFKAYVTESNYFVRLLEWGSKSGLWSFISSSASLLAYITGLSIWTYFYRRRSTEFSLHISYTFGNLDKDGNLNRNYPNTIHFEARNLAFAPVVICRPNCRLSKFLKAAQTAHGNLEKGDYELKWRRLGKNGQPLPDCKSSTAIFLEHRESAMAYLPIDEALDENAFKEMLKKEIKLGRVTFDIVDLSGKKPKLEVYNEHFSRVVRHPTGFTLGRIPDPPYSESSEGKASAPGGTASAPGGSTDCLSL